MIDDWAYIEGWSRGWWRANSCSLPQPCSNAQISPASFKLLPTLPSMQLSWQLPLFAVTVHCWHIFNLVHILAPKVLWGKAAAQPVSFLIVLVCGVTLLYGYFSFPSLVRFLSVQPSSFSLSSKSSLIWNISHPPIQYHLQIWWGCILYYHADENIDHSTDSGDDPLVPAPKQLGHPGFACVSPYLMWVSMEQIKILCLSEASSIVCAACNKHHWIKPFKLLKRLKVLT